MNQKTAIVIHGAAGRMGDSLVRMALASRDVRLVATLVRSGSPLAGTPLPETHAEGTIDLRYTTVLPANVASAVLIDFSNADAFDAALLLALEHKLAFVCGTTGLDARQQAALDAAAGSIAVLWSANFSLGVALLERLVSDAARALPDWDCEIAEAHHSAKKDAPSGTALALGRDVAAARKQAFDTVAKFSCASENSPRMRDSIGFAVTRAGDIVGEHRVMFATAGERIELIHRATDRDIFARGALTAAMWMAERAPGRYALIDALGGPTTGD